MNTKKCDSAASFKYHVDSIQAQISLTETEESWDTIERGISALKELCGDGATDFPSETITTMRGISRALNSAMNSERTRLSGAAIDLVSSVASGLGPTFEPLLHLFFPTLLTLCTRSNKVFISRARTCILSIVENTQLPSILTYFTQSLKDKSVSLRLASIEGVLACMNCFNPPDLEKDARAREIEAAIRATARDASADIRKVSRKVFEAYKVLLPNRVDNFTSPLSPTMKKYLDIKSMNPPQQALRLEKSHSARSDLPSSTAGSSATQRPASKPKVEHTRSASSSAIVATSKKAEASVANPELSRSQPHNGHQPQATRGSKDMPPPEFIPMRPARPAGRTMVASRSTSNLDERKRTISASSATSTRSLVTTSAQPSRITPSASTGALSTGAQRLNAPPLAASTRPQRPVPVASSGDVRPSATEPVGGGARRIPRPEPVQKPESSEQPKVVRPTSKNDNTRPVSRTDISTKKLEPVTKPSSRTVAPSSSTDKPKTASTTAPDTAPNPVKTGGITKPTLSQLSRTKAVMERKVEGGTKSAWGRAAPPPRKVGTTTKPLTMKKKGQDTKQADKLVVIPEAVPLPPSPVHTPTEMPLPPSPIQESKELHDGGGAAHQVGVDVQEEMGSAGEVSEVAVVSTPPTSGNLDSEGAAVATTVRPVTPPVPSGPPFVQDGSASPNRTPISTLLTSIQRGFLFTPSSPLSPPQSYLPKADGGEAMTDLSIPFPLEAVMSRGATLGFGFGFGTQKALACEESTRATLSDVEVNQLGC